MTTEVLHELTPGMAILAGDSRILRVSPELAAAFGPGDRLAVVEDTILHIGATDAAVASAAVSAATRAFAQMGTVSDDQITAFFHEFADRLADTATFQSIAAANDADIEAARRRGRSTTRLVLSDTMRADMIDGLRSWADAESGRGAVLDSVDHDGWSVELRRAGLGVVGFVFEGRPNVFADACGVIRSGNTVVFRIGSDALGTARAIVAHALDPALEAAGLPPGTASLVDSSAHAAGWAMFSDTRLSLAVARGSGTAVTQLGTVARQAGVPVSLHGTGGAWIVASTSADKDRLAAAVLHSLDRKVCNTANVCCVVADRAPELVPVVLEALAAAAAQRGTSPKLHHAPGSEAFIGSEWFESVTISRAAGPTTEPGCEPIALDDLGTEWEWEESPEISLVVVADVDEATRLFNTTSPRFVASIIAEDPAEMDRFYETVDAPFVGNGFTRWVDGQYALGKPELGLSNWQFGRLFGRGGVLSGDSVFTIRARVTQQDPDVHR